jgi:anhydro-N-acetylmuramic acid kinase
MFFSVPNARNLHHSFAPEIMTQHSQRKYTVVGLMSGTSLDGLDCCCVEFTHVDSAWTYQLLAAETLPYTAFWQNELTHAENLSGRALMRLHSAYGHYLGECVCQFLQGHQLPSPALIASHGHTIFHEPQHAMTFQLGSGAAIAAQTNLPVVADFRSLDVALGGQGAPLVPIGDQFLFGDYAACLNLGGIANISFQDKQKRIAFDCCACNMILNYYSEKLGQPFDAAGAWAREGNLHENILTQLQAVPYYAKPFPKSLGKENVWTEILPLLEQANMDERDCLRTFTEHIALQLAHVFQQIPNQENGVLITGGGAYNTFLLERLNVHANVKQIIPAKQTIEFKEALIFAWLGLARTLGLTNTLSSVTGARGDSSGGAMYQA